MRLELIGPYTEADWHRDRVAVARGEHPACPNCGHAEWFHPVGVPPHDGARRKYRACRVCGFWQDADGSPPFRSLMTAHTCLGAIPEHRHCPHCGAPGPRNWHAGCWRIITAAEVGSARCGSCGTVLTEAHVIPWPVRPE